MMYAYDVVVLAKGRQPEILTYFGNEFLASMSRVIVPLRKKEVRALVLECVPLSKVKSEIKSSEFILRKIVRVVGPPLIDPVYMQILQELSSLYIVRTSLLYRTHIPLYIFLLSTDPSRNAKKIVENTSHEIPENMLVCGHLSERILHYKAIIREAFARGNTVYIVVPTLTDANIFYSHLAQGIEQYIYILHSKIAKNTLKKTFTLLADLSHPVVIIGTASFLSCPGLSIGQLILEHESSPAYHVIESNIDIKILVKRYAELKNIPLILADTFPTIASYYDMRENNMSHSTLFHLRIPSEKEVTILDMKDDENGGNFILSNFLQRTIQEVVEKKHSIFLFSLKRGLSSHIICRDCGNTVVCATCSQQLGLQLVEGKQLFYCSHCKENQPSQMRCAHCGGWRLKELGIGLDALFLETQKQFPQFPVVCIGTDSTKEEQKKLEEIFRSPGFILTGSPKALSVLPAPVDVVCVVSFDSLIYIPHYAIAERVLSLFSTLLDCTKKHCIIQTRNPQLGLLTHIQNNTLDVWYMEELALRQKYMYPPYCAMLELRYNNISESDAQVALTRISEFLTPHPILSKYYDRKNEFRLHIKLPVDVFTLKNAIGHPFFYKLEIECSHGATIHWNSTSL